MSKCSELFDKCECDALLVLSPSNTFYLSGFESSNCQIIITKNEKYFITDRRYTNEAEIVLKNEFEVIDGDFDSIIDILTPYKKIGWDSDISYYEAKKVLEKLSNKTLVEISKDIETLRMFKSKQELENIVIAQSITEKGFNEALKALKEGVSEIEIAALIEYVYLKNGAELAFDSIVAFGKNGASPHAHRTNNKLKSGDFVTMDIGAKWKGYCSDMTRTVACGQVSSKQLDVYNTVLQAQLKAEKEIKAGMSGYEADKIARDYIRDKGYGEYFTHALGHSVGVDIHENITLSMRAKSDIIRNGMVVTVEPGIYIPDFCGVRIEDTVLIENNVVNPLAHANKNLIII